MKPKLSKIISISLGLLMVVSLLVSPGQSAMAAGSVSLDTIETPYTENFDSLGWGGGGPFSSTPAIPTVTGWTPTAPLVG
jgi:hypothetical protein